MEQEDRHQQRETEREDRRRQLDEVIPHNQEILYALTK
jgi:hypothetical protein